MSEETVIFENKAELEKVLEINQIRQLRINDTLFNILRTSSRVYVFEKGCPHMDYPLNRGHVNPYEEIVCPWHGYRFDLKTGDESARRCRPLKTLPTRWNDSGQLVLVT